MGSEGLKELRKEGGKEERGKIRKGPRLYNGIHVNHISRRVGQDLKKKARIWAPG